MAATIQSSPPPARASRPPVWRDVRVIRVVAQVVALVGVVLTIRWLATNLVDSLDDQNISTDFEFLDAPASFAVRDSPFDPSSPIRHLVWVGVRNTAAVSFVGIIMAMVLGTLVGVGRLSTNWIVNKLSALYVEILRNIPILVIIVFCGFALFTFGPLPAFNPSSPPNEVGNPVSWETGDGLFLFFGFVLIGVGLAGLAVYLIRRATSNKTSNARLVGAALATISVAALVGSLLNGGPVALGSDSNLMILSNSRLGFPSFATGDNSGLFWIIMAVALVGAIAIWIWRTRVSEETGQPHRRVLWSLGTLFAVGIIAFFALGGPLRWSFPEVSESGRRIVGGIETNDAYIALTLALGLYTASHIAEIIRGSILAVNKGQTEASNALALSGFQRYRYIILPQAFRIAVPPIINQFLNLVKNSSLGLVVAYPDITAVIRTAIGNANPAPQLIMILMLCYLSFSLTISLLLNVVNRRLQLAGR